MNACIDQLSAPTNLQCKYSQHGLTITWDLIGDSCYEHSLNYNITVFNESNGMPLYSSQDNIEHNILDLDIELESNQNFTISFKLKASQSSCESDPVCAVCEELDNSESTESESDGTYMA